MIFKPFKAVQFFLFVVVIALSACQTNDLVPVVIVQPTGSAQTPTVKNDGTAKTLQPTFTPKVTATATLPSHLSVIPGELNGIEINFWHPWTGQTASASVDLVNEFNRSNEWGIKVKVASYYSAGALYEAVTSGLEQQPVSLPDVIAAPEDQLAIWYSEKERLLSLDDYIAQPGIGLSKQEIDNFYPVFWKQNQWDSHQVGIPALRSANVVFYNQTWAKELGFQEPPKTPAEFKKQACAAAVSNNGAKIIDKYGTGGWLVDSDGLTVLSWLDAFDSHPIAANNSQEYAFDSKEGQAAFSFLRGMLDDGCAWLKRMQTPDVFFTNRLALFYSGTLQDMPVQQRLNGLAKSEDSWIVITYPREDGTGVIFSNGYSLALFRQADQQSPTADQYKKQMAGWLFVRWFSQSANIVRLTEKLPSLPVSTAVEALLNEKQNQFPWNSILPLVKSIHPAPATASWRHVRRFVEDAGWQVFQLPADQVNTILPQLDASVREIIK
jgi:ABC-type glycerol-3-phosphate transport system substrate-binding protein